MKQDNTFRVLLVRLSTCFYFCKSQKSNQRVQKPQLLLSKASFCLAQIQKHLHPACFWVKYLLTYHWLRCIPVRGSFFLSRPSTPARRRLPASLPRRHREAAPPRGHPASAASSPAAASSGCGRSRHAWRRAGAARVAAGGAVSAVPRPAAARLLAGDLAQHQSHPVLVLLLKEKEGRR
jgi:hypothetical protein